MSDHTAPGPHADHTADHTADHDALAVAHVLHALDHDEETAFGAHLAGCPICRRTVDDTTAVLGDLAGAVEPADPPPGLRQRLLDAAAAEESGRAPGAVPPSRTSNSSRPEPVEPSSRGSSAPKHARNDTDDPDDPDDPDGGTVVPLAPRRRATRWLAAAAAVVVVLAIGGLTAANQSLRAERDSAEAAAAAQAQREAAVADVLADAGTRGVPHAVLTTPEGELVGVVVDDGTRRRVLTTGLGPNGNDEVYVLWGLADGTPRPIGTFDVGGRGPDVSSVPSTPEAVAYAGFAVSLEPGRTAPASPTRVVASGQVGR